MTLNSGDYDPDPGFFIMTASVTSITLTKGVTTIIISAKEAMLLVMLVS